MPAYFGGVERVEMLVQRRARVVEQVVQLQFAHPGTPGNRRDIGARHLHLRAVPEQRGISNLAAVARSQHHVVIDDLLDILQKLYAIIACLVPCRSNQGPDSRAGDVTIEKESATIRVGAVTYVMADFADVRVGGPLREGAVKGVVRCCAQEPMTRFYMRCTILCKHWHDDCRCIPRRVDLLDLDAQLAQFRGCTQNRVQVRGHLRLLVGPVVVADTGEGGHTYKAHIAQPGNRIRGRSYFVLPESSFLAIKEDVTGSIDSH